jgi:hypothetical protein
MKSILTSGPLWKGLENTQVQHTALLENYWSRQLLKHNDTQHNLNEGIHFGFIYSHNDGAFDGSKDI